MRAILFSTILIAGLSACDRKSDSAAPKDAIAAAPAETPAAACNFATTEGLCGVRFGMTAEEAIAGYPGGLFGIEDANDPDLASCFYLRTAKDNYDIGFMVLDGQIERVDARAASVATEAGAKVGMAFADVEKLYPNSRREPNHYMFPLEDLIADLGGGVFAVFEQSEAGKVTAFRVGREPAVILVEGCS